MDFFIDLYDLGQSILAFYWTWGGLADIGLNVVGLIPGVGDLAKASKSGKNAIKTVDAVADVTDGLNDARKAIKRTDALVDASKAAKNVGNGAEAFADSSKAAKTLNKGSDALDTANDAGKALKNTDEVGDRLLLHQGAQDKHIIGTNNYNQNIKNGKRPSILTYENPQQLLDYFAHTGEKISDSKIRVDFGFNIGLYVDPETRIQYETTVGIIHHGKSGAHIVPVRPVGFHLNRK